MNWKKVLLKPSKFTMLIVICLYLIGIILLGYREIGPKTYYATIGLIILIAVSLYVLIAILIRSSFKK